MTEQQGAQRGLEFLNTESMGAESLNQGFTKGSSVPLAGSLWKPTSSLAPRQLNLKRPYDLDETQAGW